MSEYDTEILTRSEQQAALLRVVAAGAPVHELTDRQELHAVETSLLTALRFMLKAAAWPHSAVVPIWEAEARYHRQSARRWFTAGMRDQIDLAAIYDDARYALPDLMDGQPPLPVPEACPVTLDELLEMGA